MNAPKPRAARATEKRATKEARGFERAAGAREAR
ncbi:hypothetical protein BTM25_19450 [Actinomadura rubteroloni]|uniref:Uncharacterized protein n=1 Tax=Actinomadura rubteroloni TaxID=1926885 RepID=A0A2P4UR48_9ACTN|nr:hypothetical protein BTM25_19450 [Actinomadura rubteroloni]